MDIFDNKEVCSVNKVDDATEFLEFQKTGSFDLAIVPEPYNGHDELVMKPDAADFAKWLRINQPDMKVELRQTDRHLALCSASYWLPLVYLATDITLLDYLHLVVSYIYDRAKGLLAGEQPRVHLDVMYQDEKDRVTKRFRFDGDGDALKSTIKQIDINKFMR